MRIPQGRSTKRALAVSLAGAMSVSALIAGTAALYSTASLAQAPAAAGSADAGKKKNAMCIGCHGIPDYHTAYPVVYHVPMIAGQNPAYIVNALKEYRSGDRVHPSMRGIAGQLSDQDMADLAAYYGAQPGAAK